MPTLASQKNETACKKNNTFKYNILICCPFCQEVISYLQMETEKESNPFRANKVKQF